MDLWQHVPLYITAGTAVWVGIVTFRQMRISDQQREIAGESLKKDLFEARFRVYLALQTTVSEIGAFNKISEETRKEFERRRHQSFFLFDAETYDLLNEFDRKFLDASIGSPEQQAEAHVWIDKRYREVGQTHFEPWLRFKKPSRDHHYVWSG